MDVKYYVLATMMERRFDYLIILMRALVHLKSWVSDRHVLLVVHFFY